MAIEVNRQELADVLKKVFPAVGPKENDVQATCFIFREGFVYTYNDDIFMSMPLPDEDENTQSIGVLGEFAIQAKEFLAFLNKMNDETISLDMEEGKLVVKGRRLKAEIIAEATITMPIDDIAMPEKWYGLDKEVMMALKCCAPVCSKDLTKPLSTCVCLAGNLAEVSDVDKAVRYTMENTLFTKQFYVPGESARVISRYPATRYSWTDGWIWFAPDDDSSPIVACRTYYDNQPYVDMSALMETEGTLIELPKNTAEALERSEVFTSSTDLTQITMEDNYLTVEFADNWCVIKSAGGLGKCQEKLRTSYDGPKIAFSTKVEVLVAAIDKGQNFEVCSFDLGYRTSHFVKIYDDNVCHILATKVEEQKPKTKKGGIKDEQDMDDVPF